MSSSTIDVASPSGPDIVGSPGSAARPSAEVVEAAAEFEGVRPRLFGIAYQVLGRAADAEDIVQEVWIRWQDADRSRVHDRLAFLVTITTRLSLNAVTSARARREISVGRVLPSRDLPMAGPTEDAVSTESVESALALLLERLAPVERAVYVLREAFDYPFREIAGKIGITEANARQVARRARTRLGERPRGPVGADSRAGLLHAFLGAARAGEMAELLDVLAHDARGVRGSKCSPASAWCPRARPQRERSVVASVSAP